MSGANVFASWRRPERRETSAGESPLGLLEALDKRFLWTGPQCAGWAGDGLGGNGKHVGPDIAAQCRHCVAAITGHCSPAVLWRGRRIGRDVRLFRVHLGAGDAAEVFGFSPGQEPTADCCEDRNSDGDNGDRLYWDDEAELRFGI